MDLITTTKSLDSDSPSPPAQLKASTFTNGVLKKHYTAPIYRECLRNHAASMGGHALDGCGEFMPSPSAIASDPTSLKCAACGCHRNFHRRDSDEEPIHLLPPPPLQPPLRHHSNSPPSPTPPPISTSYFPSSAPQMLLALSSGGSASRKRFRTKFTQEQKDKMLGFAEKVGWKMQKRDEDSVEEFCREIGVSKGVLKVWMHNNKHILVKRGVNGHVPGNGNPTTAAANVNENGDHNIVSSNDHGINGTCPSS